MTYAEAVAAFNADAFERAAEIARGLVARAPADPGPHFELGRALMALGRWREADAALGEAAALAPGHLQTQCAYAMSSLAVGEFARGWAMWGRRIERPEYNARTFPVPPWQGEPLAGRTLLIGREQGYGDMIMAARFIPALTAQGARVIAEVPAALLGLFGQLCDAFSPSDSGAEIPRPDFFTHPYSIPRWTEVTLETLPTAPCFGAAPRSGGRVGVAWRGNPDHRWDRFRSLPRTVAERLLSRPGVVSLDVADTGAADFAETAGIVAGLEHVVSVDTAVAHLAGALGKPVTLLIPAHGPDWRWMEGRADSPWYPSVRLVRQRTPGDWDEVIDRVIADLF